MRACTVPPYCVIPLGLSTATYTIYSGLSAGKNPIKDKCKYCSYKKICGDVDYRVKRSKKASDFYVKGKDDEVE